MTSNPAAQNIELRQRRNSGCPPAAQGPARKLELTGLREADFDLDLTGFNPGEIDKLLARDDDEKAAAARPLPESDPVHGDRPA